MVRRQGVAQSPRNSRILRHRPALDARLNLLVTMLGELHGVAGTIAIDGVVRAGLEREGLKAVVDLALAAKVESKEDLDELAPKLREALNALELKGTQMMAS